MALTARALRRALVLAPIAAHKGRLALSVIAIALGVALGYAVTLINRVAANEFSHALQTLSGNADLIVQGPRSGFSDDLYPRIAALAEVAAASPAVELEVRLLGRTDSLRVLGLDVFRAAQIQPELVLAEGGESLDFLRPDRIFLSRSAAQWLSLKAGDGIALQAGLQDAKLKVAGLLSAGSVREPLGVMDIAAAQALFRRIGLITRLDLRLRPGADVDAFAARLRAQLPPGLVVERPAASIERSASLSRAYRVNLNVLALVALFTGGLLVFSTQMLAVVERRREFALLRVLGVTRGGLVRQLLAESALVGACGALIGIALGYFAAEAVLAHFGADLGPGYFRHYGLAPIIDPLGLALFSLLGVATAIGGSLAAALEAGRAEPARSLKAGDEQRSFARLDRIGPGIAVFALGAALTQAPPVDGLPLAGYAAIASFLVGVILLMPRIAALAYRMLPVPRRIFARLSLDQLRGAPGQTSVSLAAIVASVSLMTSMAIMVASFRQSLDEWLEQMLPADLYLRAPAAGDIAFLRPEDEARIASLPGVRRVEMLRSEQLLLAPERARIMVLARSFEPSQVERLVPLAGASRLPGPGEPPPAWVSEAAADIYGFRIGQVIELPIGGRAAGFSVAGIWRDYARQQGAVMIEHKVYAALAGDPNSNSAAIWLAPGAGVESIRSAIRHALPGSGEMEIAQPGEIRRFTLRIFDRTFAVTYALEAVAVLIGLFSLSSAFAALALARRCEFGVLRHLGMTRAEIGAMLACEGTLVSALGLAVGLALGWLLSLVLIHVVNRQSFHWSMDLHVPWIALAGLVAVMVPLASVAAWTGARAAMGEDAVRSVRESW